MVTGQTLKVLYNIWVKNIIEPSHIISYLEKLGYTLGFIILSEVNVISKNTKTKYTWKQNMK